MDTGPAPSPPPSDIHEPDRSPVLRPRPDVRSDDWLRRVDPHRDWLQGLWFLGSAAGCALGAALAVGYFPDAAFGMNPVDTFGPNLVGFASLIGLGFGGAQWAVLRTLLPHRVPKGAWFPAAWVLGSAIGIAGMVLPLWWYPADAFTRSPLLLLQPMLPGMVLLGLVQWALLRSVVRGELGWLLRTVIGAAVGVEVGFAMSTVFAPVPLEVAWAFFVGGAIGLIQSFGLAKGLGPRVAFGSVRLPW